MRTASIALIACAWMAAPAHAATVRVEAHSLYVDAAPGEANAVTIDGLIVTDADAPLAAGDGCVSVDEHTVRCAPTSEVSVRAGDDDDTVAVAGVSVAHLDGGPGDDTLTGARGHDLLIGGRGSDKLGGGRGRDRIRGGRGDDDLLGGPGRDRVSAGAGHDVIESHDELGERVWCGAGRDRVGGYLVFAGELEYDVVGPDPSDSLRECEHANIDEDHAERTVPAKPVARTATSLLFVNPCVFDCERGTLRLRDDVGSIALVRFANHDREPRVAVPLAVLPARGEVFMRWRVHGGGVYFEGAAFRTVLR